MRTMAKIRGITIELNGDTSGLTKSLSKVDDSIKDTKKQLKDVETLLKLDPKNVELLRQKEVLLNKAIGETKTKLDTLKKAEEKMKTDGVDENSEQFMVLQREIISTEKHLESLKKEAENTTTAFDKIGNATKKISSAADTFAQKTRKISAAGAALSGSILALGANSISTADDLATLSARTGVSTDTLQKFAYASDMVDVSTEELATAFQKMKINMDKNPESFEALGVAVTDIDGKFRPLEDVFFETISKLSEIGDETERDITSMDIFGKGADTLATIIDDGGEKLKEYSDKAEDLGLILDEGTITSLTETGDKVDELKARATSTLTELGSKLVDEMGPTLENIFTMIESLITKIGEMDGDTLQTIVTIGLVVAAISPLASAVSGISTLIGGVSSAIQFLLANPVVLLIAGIVALVALIVTKGDEIKGVLQGVDNFLQNIFTKDWSQQFGFLGSILNVFMGVFNGIWTAVKGVLTGVIDFVQGVFHGDWEQAWNGIKEIVTGVLDGVRVAFDGISTFLKTIFEKDWSDSLGAVGDVLNGLFASVSQVWNGIEAIFDGVLAFIENVFEGDWSAAWESVKSIFSGIWESFVGIVKIPLNVIIGLINGLIDGLNWLVDGINKISFSVPDWVPGIGGKSVGFNLGKIGKIAYLAQGGILSAGNAIVGENGPELLSMANGNAIVQPLTNNTSNHNYGGITLNVYGAAGQSVQELAEIIMDEIGNATRRQEAAFA